MPTADAAASDLGKARGQAAALRTEVGRLQQQAEIATEAYDAAKEQLGTAVTDYLAAEASLADGRAGSAAGRSQSDQRVASLYEAGGPLPVYAAALQAGSLGDAMDGWRLASATMSAGRLAAATDDSRTAVWQKLDARLATLAKDRIRLEAQAQRSGQQVRALLAQQQTTLAAADSRVRAIAAQLDRQAQQRAALQFQARLAAAQAQALLAASTFSNTPTGAVPAIGQAATGAPTIAAQAAISAARTKLGLPYLWGATGPSSFDCSGLTQWAYAQTGIALPRTSREQWFAGQHVDLGALLPGDLLFWATNPADPRTIHHEAMYIGGGMMLAAPHSGAVVRIEPVYLQGYVGATRPT